jgi:hypothetical protein
MKSRLILSLICLSVLACFLVPAVSTGQSTATKTEWLDKSVAQISTTDTLTAVVTITVTPASTTAVYDVVGQITNPHLYSKVLIQASSGTIYLNGSAATPSLGLPITTSTPIMEFPFPDGDSARLKLNVSATTLAGTAVKILPVR